MFQIEGRELTMTFDPETLCLQIGFHQSVWRQNDGTGAFIEYHCGQEIQKVTFQSAGRQEHRYFQTGVGRGIASVYSGFQVEGVEIGLELHTRVWMETAGEALCFELITHEEPIGKIRRIVWPGPFELSGDGADCYSVLPMRQGILIPNRFSRSVETIFDGRFYTMGLYMPWWGQIEGGNGFLAVAETPWDGGCDLHHPAGGPTALAPAWFPTLSKMEYRRVIRYFFQRDCDNNLLCKRYREYVRQKGRLMTLRQKMARNPKLGQLIGSSIVTDMICVHIEPQSQFYQADAPEQNDRLTTFDQMAEKLARLKARGAGRVYFHMDGWGSRGYDNLHPDILPPCEEAGGWDGLRRLSETCAELGYLLALHDEYISFYKKAETYREDQVVCDREGRILSECVWFGGEQSYLCSELAPFYLRRNYTRIREQGIRLDGTYLDGFTAAPVYECAHEEHRMNRRECLEKRKECLSIQSAQGYLVSSEEAVDALLPELDLVHHAPYGRGRGEEPFDVGEIKGIPVPLLNLVYHDCLVIPWSTGRGAAGIPPGEEGFLHGLLNGGLPYLSLEAGEAEIKRLSVMCRLQERVALCEMVRHEFLDSTGKRQRTTFSDGTTVEVDFARDQYTILPPL